MYTNRIHPRYALTGLAATLMLLGSSTLFAGKPQPGVSSGPGTTVDGVVLIDQAAAIAGGVTPNDAPGFPVTISEPGHYRLAGGLSITDAGNAIVVDSDDVTLDLNGYTISGPNTCSQDNTGTVTCAYAGGGHGVLQNSQRNNLTLTNGTVRGFAGDGIWIANGSTQVSDILAEHNGGIGISLAANASVHRCKTTYNLFSGVHIVAGEIFESTSNNNGAHGFSAYSNALVVHSRAMGNHLKGVSSSYYYSGVQGSWMWENLGGCYSGSFQSLGGNLCNGAHF